MNHASRSRARISVAVVYFMIGIALGVAMGAFSNHSIAPLHTLINRLGPVLTALFCFNGAAYPVTMQGPVPTLIEDAGLAISTAANLTAMFRTGGTVGAILAGWAMDRMRPTWVIAGSYLGGALCVIGVGATGALSGSFFLWVLAGFFMNGAKTGLNTFAPNCYPTVARATDVSWMLGVGRFGSILGSALGGVLVGLGWGFGAIVSALAIPASIAGLAILVPPKCR